MFKKLKLCNFNKCENQVWSGGMCKNHTPKTALKTSPKKYNSDDIIKMKEFFISIWKEKPHKSEISDTYLGQEALSIFFHHILPKEKFPQAKLDKDNIILLSLDEHTNVESDIYKYEEI